MWVNIGSGDGLVPSVSAWQHQAITWTNVDLPSAESSNIPMRSVSPQISQPSVTQSILKITWSKISFKYPRNQSVNTLGSGDMILIYISDQGLHFGSGNDWWPPLLTWINFNPSMLIHSTLYNGCNCLSILGLKLNDVNKRGPSCLAAQLASSQ